MDAQLKAKWVRALRSGEYKQTTGVLRRTDTPGLDGYCCLGVLCDLAGVTWVQDEDGDWTAMYSNEDGTDCEGGVLPDTLAIEVFGETYNAQDPQVKIFIDDRNEKKTLSALNDQGYTFADIANLIEEQL